MLYTDIHFLDLRPDSIEKERKKANTNDVKNIYIQ